MDGHLAVRKPRSRRRNAGIGWEGCYKLVMLARSFCGPLGPAHKIVITSRCASPAGLQRWLSAIVEPLQLSSRAQRFSSPGGAAGVWKKVNALAARPGMINMGQGFPDFEGSEVARTAAKRALEDAPVNQYSPQAGFDSLRKEIAAFYARQYGTALDPASEIVVTSSGQQALSSALLALLDPGDEVVIFEPFYPFLLGAIELAVCRVWWGRQVAGYGREGWGSTTKRLHARFVIHFMLRELCRASCDSPRLISP